MNSYIYKILILLAFIIPSYGAPLNAATAEWPPYAFSSKSKILGISAEIVTILANRAGEPIKIKLYPANLLNKLFEAGRIDVNFADSPLWNNADNASRFIFTKPYLVVKEYLYSLKKQKIQAQTVQDLIGMKIGISRGYYYQDFEPFFSSGKIIKEETSSNQSVIRKLVAGRTDAILMDEYLFSYLVNQLGYNARIFQKGFKISEAPVGLKFHATKRAEIIVEAFNQEITVMQQSGELKRVIDKYIQNKLNINTP